MKLIMLLLPLLASQADASSDPAPLDTVLIQWEVSPGRCTKTAPECSEQPDKTTPSFIIKGGSLEEANGTYKVQDPGTMPRNWWVEYEKGSNEKTPETWKIQCASKPWFLKKLKNTTAGYYIRYNTDNSSNKKWELRQPYDGNVVYRQAGVIQTRTEERALREAAQQRRLREEEQRAQGEAKRQEGLLAAQRELEKSLLQHEREEAQRQQALAAQQQREVAQQDSQPQLPAGQFHLPSTIKVREPKSFEDWQPTVEVYTSDEGSACPLMGVYDQMNDETSPRSWKLAYEDGNDDASETIWKRKLGNRPWYSLLKEIRGSKRNFYIRKSDERWRLYDNYANDKKGRWIYETPPTNNSNPIGLKWMLHDKCRDCKETGKKHGQDPSSCYDYNYVSNRACTCGLKCKVCDGSGKVWENRIWPF